MYSLPTDKDYKAMCHKMSGILVPNDNAIAKIDDIVSFGIRISRQDWTKIVMYFMFSRSLANEKQAVAIQRILLLPGMTMDNIEFNLEDKKVGSSPATRTNYVQTMSSTRCKG